jgi:hypothetical protein
MAIKTASYYLAGSVHSGGPLGGRLKRIVTVQGITTLDVWCWVGHVQKTRAEAREKMVRSVRAGLAKGFKRIFFALNMQDKLDADPVEVRRNLKALRDNGWWPLVEAVEAADEPDWTRAETKAYLAVVRGQIASLDLPPKPVGIMYKPEHFRQAVPSGEPFTLAPPEAGGPGPDFIGVEAYTNRLAKRNGVVAPWDEGIAKNIAYVRETFKAIDRFHPDMKLQITFQAFDRNGAFLSLDGKIHEQSLIDLNLGTWHIIKNSSWFHRVDYLRFFNWGRVTLEGNKMVGSGANYYPGLQKAHKQILKEAKAS